MLNVIETCKYFLCCTRYWYINQTFTAMYVFLDEDTQNQRKSRILFTANLICEFIDCPEMLRERFIYGSNFLTPSQP